MFYDFWKAHSFQEGKLSREIFPYLEPRDSKIEIMPMRVWQRLPPPTKLKCAGRARLLISLSRSTMPKRTFQNSRPVKRQKGSTKRESIKEGSTEEILLADVRDLLSSHDKSGVGHDRSDEQDQVEALSTFSPPERFNEVEVKISQLSSTGDGLGLTDTSDHVYVVPFTLPGETVKARVVNYFPRDKYTLTDFISITKPSPSRDNSLVKCPYFAKCSGCQFQMLSYEEQLVHKKNIIQKAYQNFSSLPPELIPKIGDTIGSPLQYGYRTKLTPHFDGPPGFLSRKAKRSHADIKWNEAPPIGFMQKGTRKTLDIEDCPIGTDVVRLGLKLERKRVVDGISLFRKGATLLLRESTKRVSKRKDGNDTATPTKAEQESIDIANERPKASVNGTIPRNPQTETETDADAEDSPPYTEEKACITDQNAISTEFVDDYLFTNPAGSFFQNNNSILPTFTAYIREHILKKPADRSYTPKSDAVVNPSSPSTSGEEKPITNLIDAYCGSGLFSITLSPLFARTLGIDIAGASIRCAHANALINDISNTNFLAADASSVFAAVTFPADETAVVLDPSRKGCDEGFLKQLMNYGPRRVCYVSCNVHTQARDVGLLVKGMEVPRKMVKGDAVWVERREVKYRLESLRGFDFFPQTGHVEGVAMLERVD